MRLSGAFKNQIKSLYCIALLLYLHSFYSSFQFDDTMCESFELYQMFRNNGIIGSMRVVQVRLNSFQLLKSEMIRETQTQQFKMPRVLRNKEYLQFLLDRAIPGDEWLHRFSCHYPSYNYMTGGAKVTLSMLLRGNNQCINRSINQSSKLASNQSVIEIHHVWRAQVLLNIWQKMLTALSTITLCYAATWQIQFI